MSSFSNRKEFVEIVAPGEEIITTHTDGSFSYLTEYHFQRLFCGFESAECGVSGTSFSTPYVAGVVALMKEYDPALVKPSFITRLLNNSGIKIYDSSSNKYYSRIDLNELFHLLDWPTENHDFRRTGFTLLKGDMDSASDVSKTAFVLGTDITQEQVLKPIVADIDGNGAMETVNFVHDTTFTDRTDIYSVEIKDKKTVKKWKQTALGGAIYFPGTLADLDSESGSRKELITGVRNGTVYAYDISSNGKTITERWKYQLPERYSSLPAENVVQFNGGNAVADIDLDGNNEIILADVFDSDGNWPGAVYVFKDNGAGNQPTKFGNYTFGNGGAYATVSVANIDSDEKIVGGDKYESVL